MRTWVFVVAFMAFGSGATADGQCDRDLLIQLAAEILSKRGELTGFTGGRVGGDAAYFMLRYAKMDAADAMSLLQTGRRPYSEADDLIAAHRVTVLGPTSPFLGHDPRDYLMLGTSGYLSVQRAILLSDNGKTYFDLVKAIEADVRRAEEFRSSWRDGSSLHTLLTDQPPEVLRQIAQRSEHDGHLAVAASLYAMMPEGEYEQFWGRARTGGLQPNELASPSTMNLNGTTALVRNAAILDLDLDVVESSEQRKERRHLFRALRAGLAEEGTQVIWLSINHTGRASDVAEVGERFLAAIAGGKIDPKRRPEEGWAFLLSAMIDVLGVEVTEEVLMRFDQTADRRHYGGRALEVLQFATAVEAAGAWLRGEVAEAPAKPASLGRSFDWPQALTAWALIKAGAQPPQDALTDRTLALAVEAHVQRGEIDAALDLAEQTGGINKRLEVARDVMLRQNRLCDQHGILPGAAVMLGGRLLHDF